MKGGHPNSGPPPDPNALRRDRDLKDWTRLPATGRSGPTPAWPLSRATARERTLWAQEWRRPQAIMWENNGQETEVALYVRALVVAEKPTASVSSRTLVRQMQEVLGLSLPGLHRNRWVIDHGTSTNEQARPAVTSTAKDRLRVLRAS